MMSYSVKLFLAVLSLLCSHLTISFFPFCEATIYSRSLKRMTGLNATYFVSGDVSGMNKLEAKSWRR
jgi:hypothetical protein